MVESTYAVEGTIYTHGFPLEYPNNMNCVQEILAVADTTIALEIKHLDMEFSFHSTDKCPYDWLQVTKRKHKLTL